MTRKLRYDKGHVLGQRKLVELTGWTDNRTALWKWECLGCHEIQGPSKITILTRQTPPKCCNTRTGRSHAKWTGYEDISGSFIKYYQRNARVRGIEFNITPEEMWSVWVKQNGSCAYTGMKLTHGIDASLDRIDSSKPYTVDNVQWVLKDINKMKMDLFNDRFIELCRMVANHG